MSDVLKVAVKRVVPSQRDPKAWSLELECGHWVFRVEDTEPKVKVAVCYECDSLRTSRLR